MKATQIAGGTLTIVAGVFTIYEYVRVDEKTTLDHVKFGADMTYTGVGFIPPYGWVVSGTYFALRGLKTKDLSEKYIALDETETIMDRARRHRSFE